MDQKDSASLLDAPLRVSTQRCHQLLCAHAEMQLEAGRLKILHLLLDAKEGNHSSWTTEPYEEIATQKGPKFAEIC